MRGSNRNRILVAAVLAVVALAAFAPVLDNGFVGFDDKTYVTENPWVGAGLTAPSVAWALTATRAANWHPLTWISHQADQEFHGAAPRGHHLTSLLLHALATVLVFLALERASGALGPSAVVAALFGAHPLGAESVAWVAERKNVLSTVFWWLAVLAYVRYARAPSKARMAWVAIAMAAGLAAKPMLVTLPFALLLLDVWPLGRMDVRHARRLVVEKIPLFALALASSVITFLVQRRGLAVGTLDQYPFGRRLANAIVSYAAYVGDTFWPSGLAAFYPYPRNGIAVGAGLAAAALLLGISVLAAAWRTKRPYVTVGWLWFVGTLVPVIGLVQVGDQARADRYMYVPIVGLLVAVVWTARHLTPRNWTTAGWGIAIVAVVALGARARVESRYWKDGATLFERAIAVAGESAVARNNAAVAYLDQGRADRAVEHARAAVTIRPQSSVTLTNLGNALRLTGRADEAISRYREALVVRPDDADAHYNLGLALADRGRLDEAIEHYRAALAGWDDARVHNNLGSAYAKLGRMSDAASAFERAVALDPEHALARSNLGVAYFFLGRKDDARRELAEARRLGHEPPAEIMRALGMK